MDLFLRQRHCLNSIFASVTLVVAMSAALVGSFGSPAAAESPESALPPGWILVEQQDGGRVLKADPKAKTRPVPPVHLRKPELNAADICSDYCSLLDYQFQTVQVSDKVSGRTQDVVLQISTNGNAQLHRTPLCPILNCYPCRVDYSGNYSFVDWLEQKFIMPADSITQTDVWKTDYIGLSPEISEAPVGAISRSGGTLEWATTVTNSSQSWHEWNFLTMDTGCGLSYITGVNIGGTAAYQYGSSFYRLSANSGMAVI